MATYKETLSINGFVSIPGLLNETIVTSVNHLNRYANEFAGRHNKRKQGTLEQMTDIAKGFIGKRLTYKELIK